MELKIMLSDILCCGYADIDFIVELEESFVEFDWSRVVPEQLDANSVIYYILDSAVSEACDELEIDRSEIESNISIFCNCLDSHLHIKTKDGCSEKMYDMDEIKSFLSKNYGNESEDDWKNTKTASELLQSIQEDKNGEHLCICNNCLTIMYDENPQSKAKRYNIEGLYVSHMKSHKDDAGWNYACPRCETDEYLMDL